MKQFYNLKRILLGLILVTSINQTVLAQLAAGTYKVGTGGAYETLGDAFDAARSGLAGNVVFELEGEVLGDTKIFTMTDLEISGINTKGKSLVIRPAAGTIVQFEGSTRIIAGTKGIVFDGRPAGQGSDKGITFRQTNSTANNDGANRGAAINIFQTSGQITFRHVRVLSDAQYGLWAQGFNNNGDTLTVENSIFTTATTTGYQGTGSPEYLRTLFFGGDITIQGNHFYGLRSPAGALEHVGLFIWHEGPRGYRVRKIFENNVIELVKPAESNFTGGIRINARRGVTKGDEFRFRHNTILLTGDAGSGQSFAIARDGANVATYDSTRLTSVNNIFINNITGGGDNAVYWITGRDTEIDPAVGDDKTHFLFDHNNIFSAGGLLGIFGPGAINDVANQKFISLADWKNFLEQETNTTNVNATFTNLTSTPADLRLNADPLSDDWYKGTSTNVTVDITGTPRRSIPAKGAYEIPGLLSGVKKIAADPNSPGDADYATLADAFDEVRAIGLADHLVLELENLFTVTNLVITNQSGDPVYNTTIRPAAGAAGVIFNGSTSISSGTSNIIFDGRPGGVGDEGVMTFRQESNTAMDAILFNAGARNLTLKYVKIENQSQYGIRAQFSQGFLTMENSVIATAGAGYQGNGSAEYFRTLFFNGDVTLKNNQFYGLKQPGGATESVGIFLGTPTVAQGGTAKTRTLINNVVEVTKPASVPFSGVLRFNQRNAQYENEVFIAQHNTFVLRGPDNTFNEATGISFVIANDTKGRDIIPNQNFDIRNNIFVNDLKNATSVTNPQHTVYWLTVSDGDLNGDAGQDRTIFNINHNNITTNGLITLIGNDNSADVNNVLVNTITDWRALGVAANTTNEIVSFVGADANPPDFSLSLEDPSLEWIQGVDLSVATDVLGQSRSNTPTKGAYEYKPVFTNVVEEVMSVRFTVYPNPSQGKVNIRIDADQRQAVDIKVYDMTGVMYKVDVTPTSNLQYELNVSDLPAGVYLIRVNDAEKMSSKRLIKI